MNPRAPTRRYTSNEIAALAAALRSFMAEHTERRDFESYDGLRETEAKLEALAEYLAADDPAFYLARLLAMALRTL